MNTALPIAQPAARSRAALIWVGLVAPMVILALATVVMLTWLPQMPVPSAVHWSDGRADGFASPWINVLLPLGVGGAVTVLFIIIALRAADGASATARLLGAVSLGEAVLMATVGLGSMHVQRGISDAADAPDIGGWMLLGFGLLIAVSLLGWFLQPKPPEAPGRSGPSATPLPLREGGRAAWFGISALSRVAVTTLTVVLFAVLALGVVLLALDLGGGWIAVGVGSLMVVAVLATSVFHVRADAGGLHVRSALGWPRYRIPAREIVAVRATHVDPTAEFGGWGIRWGTDGRFGVVLRKGPAIEVTRASGRIMVVTVDDADTAAAVLSAAAQGAGARTGGEGA